jgi:hypothetical protein
LIYYDPRGIVDAPRRDLASRPASIGGLRLAVLDNTKWNGWKLEQRIAQLLETDQGIGRVKRYKKESFSRDAAQEIIEEIVSENDLALTGIGD